MGEFKFSVKGDLGRTSLMGGTRVPKYDLRCETYGTLDEATSVLGMVKTMTKRKEVREIIQVIQEDFLTVGSEIATEPQRRGKDSSFICSEDMARLENYISDLQRDFDLPRFFILPGKTQVGACIDLARTICRRAERWAAKLKAEGLLSEGSHVQRYLNRCADLLFTLARYEDEVE